MKEDVLEQIAEDYLHLQGYFTLHNVKYKPVASNNPKEDSVDSDIDLIGYNPTKSDEYSKVIVVNCKSWQAGFNPHSIVNAIKGDKEVAGKEAWKHFRELSNEKWSKAFLDKIQELTGSKKFTYQVIVTRVVGDVSEFENHIGFKENIENCPIKILALDEILNTFLEKLKETPASSEVGRLLQLIKASRWKPEAKGNKNESI